MDLCAEIDAQLTKGLGGAKVNVQLMYVVIYRRRINTGDDTSKGYVTIVSLGLGCR